MRCCCGAEHPRCPGRARAALRLKRRQLAERHQRGKGLPNRFPLESQKRFCGHGGDGAPEPRKHHLRLARKPRAFQLWLTRKRLSCGKAADARVGSSLDDIARGPELPPDGRGAARSAAKSDSRSKRHRRLRPEEGDRLAKRGRFARVPGRGHAQAGGEGIGAALRRPLWCVPGAPRGRFKERQREGQAGLRQPRGEGPPRNTPWALARRSKRGQASGPGGAQGRSLS